MLRTPDPGSFEAHLRLVEVPCREMVRLSLSGKTEPYWAKRAKYRFDDPSNTTWGARFGVLYVGSSLETAFCESVIHENSLFQKGAYEVPISELQQRQLTWYRHPGKSQLQLVDITGEALKRIGLNNDISAGDDYTISQQWSKAIHDACPKADGLRYISRQLPNKFCYAVFERSQLVMDKWRPLEDGEIDSLCIEFNVKPV